ncbi:MAG: TipAS antibiotic-recognition domain-containing protein [Actinobacteria bacterium]|nr:TipAS antibiotic-recognition domain-containing protein [Actinomycetota bacterium]
MAEPAPRSGETTTAFPLPPGERHRLRIDRWFYPCSHQMHVNLGRMYVADPRFAATYEKARAGMAQYMCDAIEANAARVEG